MEQEIFNKPEEVTTGGAATPPESPTVPVDLGSGSSASNDSVFGMDHPEESDQDDNVQDIGTLPFTQAGSVFVSPSLGAGYGSNVPTGTISAVPAGEGPSAVNAWFNRRQAKPTFYKKGTNVMIPFGAAEFIKALGTADITDKGSTAVINAESVMNALVPSLNTPGSYRVVTNWRRVYDLKNVVISWFNRSIPFTDLTAGDRFAIEMCYMRDVAFTILPIHAKSAAIEYVKHCQKAGFQYDTRLLSNLNSLTLERLLKQIYNAVAALPAPDPLFFKRIAQFSKLRVTAKRSGFTPVIISQDVAIGGPGRYKIPRSVSLSSGYNTDTTMSAITGKVALNGTTLHEWMEMWLRSDKFLESDVAAVLEQILQLAQSVRTNYSILLACAAQLEQKGAVKYDTISTFLPVTGSSDFMLTYEVKDLAFSYSYKERVEYAPRKLAIEDAGGAAATAAFNIATLPDAASSSFSQQLSCLRPAGLYKGGKCWGTRELAAIGLFKEISLGSSYLWDCRLIVAGLLGVTLTTTGHFVGSGGNTSAVYYLDAYYGDVYSSALTHVAKVSATDTNVAVYNSAAPLISYYGVGDAQQAPYCTLSTYIADGGSESTCLNLVKGSHIVGYVNYDLSSTESPYLIAAQQLIALLQQCDLTLYLSETKNEAGRIATPIILLTGYRGAIYDEFDLAPLDNAYAASYHSMALGLKVKSQSKVDAK